jgi:hypothetical protein
MSCQLSPDLISSLLDRRLAGAERENALAHIESCRTCSAQFQFANNMRMALRKMNQTPVPEALSHNLRVLASHERVRQVARASFSARVNTWMGRMKLSFDNMMRPFAMPFASGMLSAALLFTLLTPGFSYRRDLGVDPSTDIVTMPDGKIVGGYGVIPRLKMVGNASSTDHTVVELYVDQNGKVRDWRVIRGELTYDVKNIILFSTFTPATYFGYPIAGKILVTISSPARDNRG